VSKSFRPLVWFWSGFLIVSASTAALLEYLGPPRLPVLSEPEQQRVETFARFDPRSFTPGTHSPARPDARSLPSVTSPLPPLETVTVAPLVVPKSDPGATPRQREIRQISRRPTQSLAHEGTFTFSAPATDSRTFQDVSSSFLGTYTTGPDGVRVFVPNP
jgi:hypothetical protein